MSARLSFEATKEILKHFVSCLQAGETPETLKPELKKILRHSSPLEFAHLESELIREQLPREALLCLHGMHVACFREMFIP